MKNLFKKIALTLTFALSIMFTNPIIEAKAYERTDYNNIEISDLILTEEEIQLANDYIQYQLNNGNIAIMPRSAAALAGTFFIPGVGQAVITAAGVIIVGGAVVSAGSWLGQKVSDWVYNSKKNDAEKASAKIPNSLKKGNGNVDVNKFTQKVKGKQEWKDPKTGWSIDKDTAGHRGYDGSIKTWKIKNQKGTRIGSLNSNGKVIDN
ncbi:hypothetical protein PTL64_15650 [Clostridium perfringens]|nr:hypothetical protein [Clostridium perfringens]